MSGLDTSTETPLVLDTEKPLPSPLDQDVILVAVDVERHCYKTGKQGVVTEIGVAWLDTKDAKRVEPGDRGHGWFSRMQYKHFRVSDLGHLHIAAKCRAHWHKGDSMKFRFELSEWVTMAQLPTSFNSLMDRLSVDAEGNPRNIIPVTFEPKMELDTFEEHGLHLFDRSNASENVDTRVLRPARVWKDQGSANNNPPALGKLSLALGLVDEAWLDVYAHNGGNDAVLTLQGYIAGLLLTDDQLAAMGHYKEYGQLPDCLPLLPPSWPLQEIKQPEMPTGVTWRMIQNHIHGNNNGTGGPPGRGRGRGGVDGRANGRGNRGGRGRGNGQGNARGNEAFYEEVFRG